MDVSRQLHVDLARFDSLISSMEIKGVSTIDLIIQSNLQLLSKKLNRSIKEIEDFVRIIDTCEINPTAPQKRETINTGIMSLDKSGFNIRSGEVTEVFGQSGSGKSQFLYQISCLNQLTPKKKVIFINTETFLETKRLSQVMEGFNNKDMSLDNIEYIYCQDLEIMDHILFTQLPVKLQSDNEVGCLIIDSIGHHLRKEESVTSNSFLKKTIVNQHTENESLQSNKAKFDSQFNTFFKTTDQYDLRINKKYYLMNLYKHLVKLAKKHEIAVVMSNQITDQLNSNGDKLDLDYQVGWMSGWDHRTTYNHQNNTGEFTKKRKLQTHIQTDPDPNKSMDHSVENASQTQSSPELSTTNKQKLSREEEEELEEQYYHYLSTYSRTKVHIPSLGYHWNKLIDNRILLVKCYKPIVNSEPGQKRKLDDFNGWTPERYLKIVPFDEKHRFTLSSQGLR